MCFRKILGYLKFHHKHWVCLMQYFCKKLRWMLLHKCLINIINDFMNNVYPYCAFIFSLSILTIWCVIYVLIGVDTDLFIYVFLVHLSQDNINSEREGICDLNYFIQLFNICISKYMKLQFLFHILKVGFVDHPDRKSTGLKHQFK